MIATIGIGAFVMLFLGVPIWMIFVLMAGVGITMSGVSMEIVVQGLSGSINKLVLLSIPGFIFAGGVMGKGGMSTRLLAWLSALIGRIPGGLPLTTVAGAEIFGAISGSSAATVAALGKILYPALIKEGYGERFSLGLITSSGAIAMIIPPSITMILFAVMTNASVGKLFLAGVIPGLVVGACVGVYCLYYALKNGIASGRSWDLGEIVRTTREVSWTIGAPLLIFVGIYGGFMTPTEASMAVSVYAVLVCVYVYGELSWGDVWEITRETSLLSAKILIIMAAASVFSWVLTAEQVPQNIKLWIDAMNLSPLEVIWMINIILLIVGMLMDPNSAILLFTPLLWPIAEHAGLDIIHFGIIFTVNLAIGMFTPPFGLNIFVSVSIFRENTAKIVMGVIPFFIAYLVALALITHFPALSLALPNMLGQ